MKLTKSLAVLTVSQLLCCSSVVYGRSLKGNSQRNNPNDDGSCGPGNNPVCVDGEITFQNPCLAEAQGEMDYTNGPCTGKDMHFRGSGAATVAQMRRFTDEGFLLVGKVTNRDQGPPPLTAVEQDDNPGAPGQMKKLTRVTPDGLKYVTKEHISTPFDTNPGSQNDGVPSTDPEYDGEPPVDGNDRGRRLQIGADTRTKVASTSVYPYWRLGEVDWSGEGGCSGSIVGTNKVLVAAHCVYDTFENQWQIPSKFAPGRYRDCWQECPSHLAGGCHTVCDTKEPWGTWPVQYVTFTTMWQEHDAPGPGLIGISSDGVGADVAILTMGTNWAGNIGSHMGTLEIIVAPCTINPGSTTTGYPAEKPDGEMWTSGQCPWWGSGCDSDRIIVNTCDTSPGHSGSAVYDNYNRVFGVVSAGGSSNSYFFGFSSAWRNMVLSW